MIISKKNLKIKTINNKHQELRIKHQRYLKIQILIKIKKFILSFQINNL